MLYVGFRRSPTQRLDIIAPKSLFKRAVDRNLVKRWLKEAFREYKKEHKDLERGVYTIKVKNKDLLNQKYRDIKRLLHNSL